MESIAITVGVDVSKDWLDACLEGGRPFRVPNTACGVGELALRLPAGAVVRLESSGGYERAALRGLERAGYRVVRLDPLKVRRLAQAMGRRAKTDALDARHLASDAAGSLPGQSAKSPERERLCDLSRSADALRASAAGLKKSAGRPGLDPAAREALLGAAKDLASRAQGLERAFLAAVGASPLSGRHALARSVPGVGPCLARKLVCELPEDLGAFTPAQICAYAGVAPMDDQSGKRAGRARLGRGNARLKAALYMPACSLLKSRPWARELYRRLRGKGLAHQQAAVALMRRLLTMILAVLRRGTPWQECPPMP